MTFEEYQTNVTRTMNSHDPQELQNYLFGIVGEVGELINHLKKYLHHGHDLNLIHTQEEIGDCLWYLSAIAAKLQLSMDDIAIDNIIKLEQRYPTGFSQTASIERKDVNV